MRQLRRARPRNGVPPHVFSSTRGRPPPAWTFDGGRGAFGNHTWHSRGTLAPNALRLSPIGRRPTTANIWIQLFAKLSRDRQGRIRHGELVPRTPATARLRSVALIEDRPSFFYTVALPVPLWFLDREKARSIGPTGLSSSSTADLPSGGPRPPDCLDEFDSKSSQRGLRGEARAADVEPRELPSARRSSKPPSIMCWRRYCLATL